MRRKVSNDEKKLISLRNISQNSQYSPVYISLLVQRKKLKAKKVGRNYFTTKEWFNEYLERHARDNKRDMLVSNELIKPKVEAETRIEE